MLAHKGRVLVGDNSHPVAWEERVMEINRLFMYAILRLECIGIERIVITPVTKFVLLYFCLLVAERQSLPHEISLR